MKKQLFTFLLSIIGLFTIGQTSISTAGLTGSGTTNYVPKFSASKKIANSIIYNNATSVGIATTSPQAKLHVVGTSTITPFYVTPQTAPFGASFKVLADGRIESFIEGSIVSAENMSFGRNTGIGQGDNMNFGINAGANQSTLTANGNNNFGYSAGASGTSAGSCVNIGKTAGFLNLISSYNVNVGDRAGYGNLGEENIFIGTQAGFGSGTQTGPYNVATGKASMFNHATATGNCAYGYNSLFMNTSGHYNSVFGYGSGLFNLGGNNSFYGRESGYTNTTGAFNTYLGTWSGYANSTGDNGVYVGYGSGYYETASNKLFIDNATRANESDGRSKALIYGVFDASPANQVLYINAASYNLLYLPTSSSGLSAGRVWDSLGYLKIKH